jgi:hypothetical protein
MARQRGSATAGRFRRCGSRRSNASARAAPGGCSSETPPGWWTRSHGKALRSGDAAATSLLAGSDPERAYNRRVRAEIYEELLRAARLKAHFFRPHFTALLITALLKSERIRAVMADLIAGRQTYHGLRRRLLSTGEIGLAVDLLRRRLSRTEVI